MPRKISAKTAAAFLFAAALSGCASAQLPVIGGTLAPTPASPASLPGWTEDDIAGIEGAIERQCELTVPPAPWPRLCVEFRQQRADLKPWIARRFKAWSVLGRDNTDNGLITGYYEPIVTGSRVRENDRQTPLYRRPPDLLRIEMPSALDPAGSRLRGRVARDRVVPYYTRADIDARGVLKGQELIWLDDAVDTFFLHVQGSGRVRLRDGTTVRVVFADSNGHGYRPIGRVLVDRGQLAAGEVSAQTIKRWLRANPQQAPDVMNANPRYVFFREQAEGVAELGPPGSLTVALTPQRSIASDARVIPPGSLVYMQTTHPSSRQPMQRLMISQDTGIAIVGPVRADVFWGNGEDAEKNAGLMQEKGRLWLLWPDDLETPPQRGLDGATK